MNECCEYPLKFPVSACHCSLSIGINPQNNQPSNMTLIRQRWFASKFKNIEIKSKTGG